MSAAVTALNGSIIHSLLQLPVVDYTYAYEFIKFPILSGAELKAIESLRKRSHKALDLFICSKAHKSIRLMSTSDLSRCLKTASKNIIVCKGRKIKQHVDFEQNCKKIPDNIIVELNPKQILIKTEQKYFTVVCNNYSEKIHINASYSLLDIDEQCRLIGKDFMIGE